MAERFSTIEAEGVRLTLDLAVGHVRRFEVERDGARILPLHVAPWVDDPAIASDPAILPNLKFLAGDFFCAPFGKSDVEDAPSHGWPANSEWTALGEARFSGGVTARFELVKRVMGAKLVKEITLRDGHPFAYQRHVFSGGSGAVSVASHAMTNFPAGGRLSFSPKAFGETPPTQQETDPKLGRSLFATGVRFTDLSKLPLADGSTADLHRYPVADRPRGFRRADRGEGLEARLDRGRPARCEGYRPQPEEPRGFPDDVPLVQQRRAVLQALERSSPRRARDRGRPRLHGAWPRRLDRAQSDVRGGHCDFAAT